MSVQMGRYQQAVQSRYMFIMWLSITDSSEVFDVYDFGFRKKTPGQVLPYCACATLEESLQWRQ